MVARSRTGRLLMHISELLFHELMADTAGGTKRFQGIADDQVRMEALFEEFLRKFYDLELLEGRARAEIMPWDAASSVPSDLAYLPVMKTGITIRVPGRVLVVDAKYYPSHLTKSQYGEERPISGHLYQLSTYLAHAAVRETADCRLLAAPMTAPQRAALNQNLARLGIWRVL
ncbi:MAG: hypothetical protein ABL878_06915 [Burkholderiales bacterium]